MRSIYQLAEQYFQQTNQSFFLTGKAGSGKTTLLRKLRRETSKKVAVVAPTGIAAINAEGVTIHSFFQLPLLPFIPTQEGENQLISGQKLRKERINVMRQLEVLVVDEVSMLRADVLDMMDTVLRHVRRRDQPFGGVQMVFIGDLYQLQPVSTPVDHTLLSPYYDGVYFFNSKAVQKLNLLYLELDKIFRQSNQDFVTILNEVRHNTLSAESFEKLHQRYKPNLGPNDALDYITLTTHNAKADVINRDKLNALKTPLFEFTAQVSGQFYEKSYPNDETLQLKKGARVMMIHNDNTNHQYVNGSCGTIVTLTKNLIEVELEGESQETITVSPEIWRNIKYNVNKKDATIEEEELGTFQQYPIRLAWAITIHKAQGLTFDKIKLDVAKAFSSGQVYVAMSRCRSLEGIIFTSELNRSSLSVNRHVESYGANKPSSSQLESQYDVMSQNYRFELLKEVFDLLPIEKQVKFFIKQQTEVLSFFTPSIREFLDQLEGQTQELYGVDKTFQNVIQQLIDQQEYDKFSERVTSAIPYYTQKLEGILRLLEHCSVKTESKPKAEDFDATLHRLHEDIQYKLFLLSIIQPQMEVTEYFEKRTKYHVVPWKMTVYSVLEIDYEDLENKDLYRIIKDWRTAKKNDLNVEPYTILKNQIILDLCTYLPQREKQLLQVSGVGPKTIEKYGEDLLGMINRYVEEKHLEEECKKQHTLLAERSKPHSKRKESTPSVQKDESLALEIPTLNIEGFGRTKEETLYWFKQGKTVKEIAELRQLSKYTVGIHLASAVEHGVLAIDQLMSQDRLNELIPQVDITGSKKENFDKMDGVSYEELNYVFGFLKHQQEK